MRRREAILRRRDQRPTTAAPSGAISPRATFRHYLPDLVFGANDGIITTFAVVSGVTGAGLAPRIILIIGFANLLADGFSMAASNYLSMRSRVEQGGPAAKAEGLFHGFAIFLAFVAMGCFPLFGYLVPLAEPHRFPISVALTLLVLFGAGAARSLVIAKPWWRSGAEMLLVGTAAAAVAYGVGALVALITGGQAEAP